MFKLLLWPKCLILYFILFIVTCVIIFVSGCAGTGFDRKTSLMPDEFSITNELDTETFDFSPKLKLGLKWKFQ